MDIDTFHCLRIIDNLALRGIKTYFQLIPSPCSISGSHKEDEIAKYALNIDQPSGGPIPIRYIYRWILLETLLNKNNPILSPFPKKCLSKIYLRIRSGSNGPNFQAFSYQFPNLSDKVSFFPLCTSCNVKNK